MIRRTVPWLGTCVLATLFASPEGLAQAVAPKTLDASNQLATYSEIVHRNYTDAYRAVLQLKEQVDVFVAAPGDDGDEQLALVRQAWLDTRGPYGQTEAFRFYEGPIDFGKQADGSEGPEGLINGWPVNEAHIDSVRGNPGSGIINDPSIPITRATLVERNAKDDEADITTGFHAIEFLLWGQDFNANGPGNRIARDFVGVGAAERRRTYLQVATDLLAENLQSLVAAWAPDQQNYRQRFAVMPARTSVSKILQGVASLSGLEVAAERLATPLDSGSQEDEHSCFSDSTHVDILANVTGVANVYFGRYGDYQGSGLNSLIKAVNPELNQRLEDQIERSVELATALDRPFDRILTTPPGSPQRAKVEALVTSLQTQARLFKLAAAALEVDPINMLVRSMVISSTDLAS